MSTDEEAFLAAIAAHPDDEAPHKVFADWLDEHDRPEEADWHRHTWTTEEAQRARKWFDDYASGHTHGYHEERAYTGEELIQAGRVWIDSLKNGGRWGESTTQDGGVSLQDDMYNKSNRLEFWRNWALATGIYIVVDEIAEDGYVFSCSC